MKKIIVVLSFVLIAMLVSCASSSKDEAATASVAAPSAQVAVSASSADEWWNSEPQNTADFAYAVGLAKGSTTQISRDWARANANQKLAEFVSNSVDAIVTTYVNDAGEITQQGNNMQAMQAFESVSKQRAQAVLSGVQFKYHTEPDGTVYALASLPIGPVAEELKAQVKEAFVKNQAAEEANNMMNAAIDKYFANV